MQTGAVLIFKPGVSPEQAARALAQIQDLLELPNPDATWTPREWKGKQPVECIIHSYDPSIGSPCWYIP
jgi:hypothetical protein